MRLSSALAQRVALALVIGGTGACSGTPPLPPSLAAAPVERGSGRATSTVRIDFDFDAIARQPNTLDAHRLVAWGQSRHEGDPQALVEALFRAYFLEGRFVGDRAELATIAAAAGYDAADAQAFVASGALRDEVAAAEAQAREMGVSGVPFFIFDGKTALSGAQEPATMLEAIARARAA